MAHLMAYLATFFCGMLASILANWVYNLEMFRPGPPLKITGDWAEFIPDSKGRQFSLGAIYYNARKRMYCFDGTNFRNNGDPYCYWETMVSHLDRTTRELFYVFSAQIEGELDKKYYGFGVVKLAVEENCLVPVDGHYVSANVDHGPMSHSMERFDGPAYKRGANGRRVVDFLNRKRTVRTARRRS